MPQGCGAIITAIAFDFGMLDLSGKRMAQLIGVLTIFSTTLCKPHPIMHVF